MFLVRIFLGRWLASFWPLSQITSIRSAHLQLLPPSALEQKMWKIASPSIYGFAGFFPFRHVYLVCIQMHPTSFFTKSKYSLTSHIASDMNAPTSSILPNNLKLRLSSSLYFFYMNSQVSQSHCCLVPPKSRTRGSCRCCESRPCWPPSPCCSCS